MMMWGNVNFGEASIASDLREGGESMVAHL